MATDKIKFDKYILIRYFQEYLPVDKEGENVIYKTSPADPGRTGRHGRYQYQPDCGAMVELGYSLAIAPDGRPAWMMLCADSLQTLIGYMKA